MDTIFRKYVMLCRKCWLEAEKECGTEQPDEEELLELYRELNREEGIRGKLEDYRRYPAEVRYREFCIRVNRRRVVVKTGWRWVAAAAMVILMIGGGLYFWPSAEPALLFTEEIRSPENIVPGTKKALLTLADGNVVHIGKDSMQIREQKGAQIGYAEGKLSYHSTREITELVYNELAVPVSGECYLVLDDGTKVWINSDSRLKYPVKFTGKERKVYLQGEAYFEVAKGRKPFIVTTSLGSVRVLGTAFGVKAYPEEHTVSATLVSGKVNFTGNGTLDMMPGEQVLAYADGKMEKRKVDPDEYIGWQRGLYVFKNRSLEEIMTELSRWYGVSVFYQNPDLKAVRFTGNLKRYDHIGGFMQALERTGDVRYKITGNTIMLFQ